MCIDFTSTNTATTNNKYYSQLAQSITIVHNLNAETDQLATPCRILGSRLATRVIDIPGLQLGKTGVETIDEREETDIEVDECEGNSLLSNMVKVTRWLAECNDEVGSM